jgi:hypothetical protein
MGFKKFDRNSLRLQKIDNSMNAKFNKVFEDWNLFYCGQNKFSILSETASFSFQALICTLRVAARAMGFDAIKNAIFKMIAAKNLDSIVAAKFQAFQKVADEEMASQDVLDEIRKGFQLTTVTRGRSQSL